MSVPLPEGVTDDDVAALRRYVGADATKNTDLAEVWAEAQALVVKEVGAALVPGPVMVRAIKECASELWHRRSAPGGVMQQFTDLDAAPVRMARDPMLGARPLLAPWLPGGFA